MEFCRRSRAEGLETSSGLHDLPALRLLGGSALPHPGGLELQAEAAGAGRASDQKLPVVGTVVAEGKSVGLLRRSREVVSRYADSCSYS